MNRFPHNKLSHAQSNVDIYMLQAFELSSSFCSLSASKQFASVFSHEIRAALNSQLPSTSQNFRDSKEKSRVRITTHRQHIFKKITYVIYFLLLNMHAYTVSVTSNKYPDRTDEFLSFRWPTKEGLLYQRQDLPAIFHNSPAVVKAIYVMRLLQMSRIFSQQDSWCQLGSE